MEVEIRDDSHRNKAGNLQPGKKKLVVVRLIKLQTGIVILKFKTLYIMLGIALVALLYLIEVTIEMEEGTEQLEYDWNVDHRESLVSATDGEIIEGD